MQLAQEANRYIDEKAPWKVIKQDRAAAARSVYTTLGLVSALKTIMYPYLPFSSKKLHNYLGFESEIENAGWKIVLPVPGTKLPVPQALFIKLDDSIVATEMERMGTSQ